MAGLDDLSIDQLERLRVQRLAVDKAEQYNLDPEMFTRQIKQESGFNPRARSPAGAIGPGQLMPGTARELGVDPNDPAQNIDGAARYMRQNLDRFGGDPRLALAAYHAGPGSAEAALRNPAGNPKTNAYVNAIAGDGAPDLDSMSLEELQALRAKVAGPARPKPPPMKPKPPIVGDVIQGGATGVAQGVNALRHPGADALDNGLNLAFMLAGKITGQKPDPAKVAELSQTIRNLPSGVLTNPFRGQTTAQSNADLGIDYEAQTIPGKIAQKTGQFAPAALSPGSIPVRVASVALPAAGAVAGREGVKALGGGEGAQAAGEIVGSLVGGVAPSLRLPKLSPRAVKGPSLDELRAQKTAAYEAADLQGVSYKPDAVKALANDAKAAVADDFDPDLHTSVKSALKKLDSLTQGGPVTLGKLDKARQYINENVLASNSKAERRLGYIIRDKIDEMIAASGPETVEGGANPQAAAASLKKARELNTRLSKAEAIEGGGARAQTRAKQTGSGGNINNATRQEIGKIRDRRRDWTPDERKALTELAEGSKANNLLRQIGKLSPSGNGLQQSLTLGAAFASHGASVPLSVAGMVAKGVADRATVGKVEKLVQLVASGGQSGQSARAELALLAKQNPQVPLLASQTARRLLVTGAVAAPSSLAATPAAAREAPKRR